MSTKKDIKAAAPKKPIAKQPEPAKKQAKTSFAKGDIGPNSSQKVKRGTMHPNYREITVVQTDGTVFHTRSTYKNTSLKLDIDIKTRLDITEKAVKNFIFLQEKEKNKKIKRLVFNQLDITKEEVKNILERAAEN